MGEIDFSGRAPVLLLVLATIGWYAAARAAAQALAGQKRSPLRRAIGYCLPVAVTSLAAVIVGRAEIAVGVIFASSVACMTLVLGIVTLADSAARSAAKDQPNPDATLDSESQAVSDSSRKLWGFLLPVALIVLLIGFHGSIGWMQVLILLVEGAALVLVYRPVAAADHPHAKPDSRMIIQLAFALLAAAVATWAGVRAARDISNSLGLSGYGLVTALMVAPALVLSMIGSGSALAGTGRYDQAVLMQVGFVLMNLCGLLPLIAVLWLTRPYWNPPVMSAWAAVIEPAVVKGSPATTSTSRPVAQENENAPTDLPYPMAAWRVDAVLLVAVGLLLLPAALGRWSIGGGEGLALLFAYLLYMTLTTAMAR